VILNFRSAWHTNSKEPKTHSGHWQTDTSCSIRNPNSPASSSVSVITRASTQRMKAKAMAQVEKEQLTGMPNLVFWSETLSALYTYTTSTNSQTPLQLVQLTQHTITFCLTRWTSAALTSASQPSRTRSVTTSHAHLRMCRTSHLLMLRIECAGADVRGRVAGSQPRASSCGRRIMELRGMRHQSRSGSRTRRWNFCGV
jgi:hypothetical protein